MQVRNNAFKPRRAATWTRERIEQLGTPEIKQLRINAGTLGENEIVALCDQALSARPRGGAKRGSKKA